MKKPLAGLLIAAAVTLGLFLDKPFHIDDAYQLRVARQIQASPGAPYEAHYNWTGVPVPIWLNNLHPPLNAYVLAIAVSVVGESEAGLHAIYLLIALACLALMHTLASGMCRHPSLPVLMTLAAPAFFLSATSIMTDVLMLGFWIAAVALAREAARPGRTHLLWAAGIFASAAAMTNLFGLSLVPLLLADWAMRRRRFTAHLLGLLLPLAVVGLWGLYSMTKIGFFHPFAAGAFAASAGRGTALVPGVAAAFLGGCLLWPLMLPAALPLLHRTTTIFSVGLWLVFSGFMPVGTDRLWALLALGGILAAAAALESGVKNRDADSVLLLLWLFGTLLFAGVLNWTISARSLLPCALPAALLTVRWMESSPRSGALIKTMRCALVPCMALTMMLAFADRDMAGAHRQFAQGVARRFLDGGARVFFIGHWGFQHYMEKEGAVAFNYRHPALKKGDVLLVSTNNTGALPPAPAPEVPDAYTQDNPG